MLKTTFESDSFILLGGLAGGIDFLFHGHRLPCKSMTIPSEMVRP